MAEEKDEVKISKISSLINQAQEDINGMKIVVHYSEDKWKTNEEVELILGEETTIGELIQISKQKFNKPNINNKKLFVRIFKKKKKIPNEEYPICNLESKIKDYGKSHFCLVDEESASPVEEEKEEVNNENEIKKVEEEKGTEKNNDNVKGKDNNNENNKVNGKGKKVKGKCKKRCMIF